MLLDCAHNTQVIHKYEQQKGYTRKPLFDWECQIICVNCSDRNSDFIDIMKKWVSDSRFKITYRRRTANRHMGTAASGLSEAILQSYIHQSSYKWQAECLSYQHWQTGAGTLWKAHRGHETSTGHNGTAKIWKCLRMGRTVRQHKSLCKGDCK